MAMPIDTAARVFGITDNFKITDLGSRLALDRGDHLVEWRKPALASGRPTKLPMHRRVMAASKESVTKLCQIEHHP
jgi:hypothetical protein